MKIFEYSDEEEREMIVESQEKEGMVLVEIQNYKNGNFLGFREPGWISPKEAASLIDEISALQAADLDNKALINGLGAMIASMYGA